MLSQFIDEAIVEFESGRGGDGSASFHREKHVPRGGPNGADGGRGGHVILVANRGMRTLYDFKLLDHYKATDGSKAQAQKAGRDAEDLLIKVPVGTMVFDTESNDLLADLDSDNAQFVVAKGGRGGRGNLHFTNSVRQSPSISERGEPSEKVRVKLELKLLADVGLIGLPNAGKSTLISSCSAARPKIGAYPFTTITPNLGVVQVADTTFVMSDMPGLIEGASEGVGLGHQFLKHVERTKVLVHVVDIFPLDQSDPISNFELVEKELELYDPGLKDRPRIILLSKIDLGSHDETENHLKEFQRYGFPVFAVSAATQQGIQPFLFECMRVLKEELAKQESVVIKIVPQEKTKETWKVKETPDGFEVEGRQIVRMVEMTNLANNESVRYLHRRLHRMGVIDELREKGAIDGDTVQIGDWEFQYMEGW